MLINVSQIVSATKILKRKKKITSNWIGSAEECQSVFGEYTDLMSSM